jgi:hypothetical protein
MENFDNTNSTKQAKTYEDGLEAGERRGKREGYDDGLTTGRTECYLQKQADAAEKQRQAALESRRVFWDTAFPQDPKIQAEESKFDARSEASKADTNLKAFIADVQVMTPNEVLATEKELDSIYSQKQAAWKQHHGWFEHKPSSPMSVHRGDSGAVTSIEFPQQGFTIPVTYWNSQVEANRIDDLSIAVQKAPGAMERSVALKALADELSTLKIPQIAQLEARKAQH